MRKALCLFVSAILIFLISCENFMNGSNASDELDQMIDEANAKACTLIVSQDTTMGSFLSSGDKTCKVGYSIEVQFTVKKELYVYRGLKAVSKSDPNIDLGSYVQFKEIDANDSRGVYKTSIKLLKESQDILIIPDCSLTLNAVKDECKPDFYEGGREQDSTVTIVFNQAVTPSDYFVPVITDAYGQSLSQYFEEPYFSNDSKTLYIPTAKGNDDLLLIKQGDSNATKDIFVRIDLSQLKDKDGNTGSGTFQHKYRVNKTQDSYKPVITGASLYSTSDTTSRYYKALPCKNYTGWTADDYRTYHIGGKVYAEFKASDVGSGISGLYVKETVCKYSDGTNGNEVVTDKCRATWDQAKESWCVEYNMRTAFDGIIKLELFALDFAGNKSDSGYTFYVLKDSTIITSDIVFDTEYSVLNINNFSLPDIEPTDENIDAEENFIKVIKNINESVDQNGNQTVTLKLSPYSKDVYYYNLYTDYDIDVYWGYSENSIDTKATKKTDGSFTFRRDADKFVFIKTVCTDQAGNTRTVLKRMIPRVDLEVEDNPGLEGSGRENEVSTILRIKDSDSLKALCMAQSSPANVFYLYQFNYTQNNSLQTSSKFSVYSGMEEMTIRTDGSTGPAAFLCDGIKKMNLLEDVDTLTGLNASVKVYLIPFLGDFPPPYSSASVNYTVTEISKSQQSAGKVCIGNYKSSPEIQEADCFIYGSGPTLSNMASANAGTITFAEDAGYGPINENIKLTVKPIKNTGRCKIVVENYEKTGYENHDVSYTFTILPFSDPNNSGTYTFPKGFMTYKTPEIYIDPMQMKLLGIHIEAYDRTDNKKYVPIPLPDQEAEFSSLAAIKSVCASSIVLEMNQDVNPPCINVQYSYMDTNENPIFYSSGAYRIGGITDNENNLITENGMTKITYYLIPNSIKDSPHAGYYTWDELKDYSAFARTLYFKPSSDGGSSYIDIPYGNTKEGFYTLVIAAEDKAENYSLGYAPVLNTIKGELIENIKDKWVRTTNLIGSGNLRYGWMLSFDTRGHDEIVHLSSPGMNSEYSINSVVQFISYNEYENVFTWTSPEKILIGDNVSSAEENGQTYYNVTWEVERRTDNMPWVRLRSYYGFDDSNNQTVVDKGFYYTEYLYIGVNNSTCFSKNCLEGLNGLQVMSDRPVFAHTMYCPDKLTENTKVANAARIWETKGIETGIAVLNQSINEPEQNYFNDSDPDPSVNHAVGSETYDNSYIKNVPAGYWYTTIFHFADGTVVMTDIKQR